jgi:hypothetical protein
VKLGKTATETLQLLRDAYGDEALSRAEKKLKGRPQNTEVVKIELTGM